MNYQEIFYPESRFGGITDIDGTIAFLVRVHTLLQSASTVLDVGCGRGRVSENRLEIKRHLGNYRAPGRRVTGIDVDPDAAANPNLDEFRLIEGAHWPVEDKSIDLIVGDYVLEHVPDPEHFFGEMRRVLRDGGQVCLRTTNSWGYVAFFSRLLPNRHHARVLGAVQTQRQARDVFPTVYRCNSLWKIRRMFERHGFTRHAVYGYEAEPSYLSFSMIAYFLGVLHQRWAPGFLKPAIFAYAQLGKGA